jgi:2-polyprenyl-3-methyl-5-hydroxy-6-metoxy-1,4-benzoquinol methylase
VNFGNPGQKLAEPARSPKARSWMHTRAVDSPIRKIVASYRNPVIRLYSMIRFAILRQVFLDEIGQYLPASGRILDIGCGFGLFSLYFAAMEPGRELVGLDTDDERISYARASGVKLGLDNVSYQTRDAQAVESDGQFEAIYLLDLIHHLPKEDVPEFLEKVRGLLSPGGILLVKEVEDRPRWKMYFTLLLDRLMVGSEPIHYWAEPELTLLLTGLGFEVRRHRMKDFLPYPHILYVCRSCAGDAPPGAPRECPA